MIALRAPVALVLAVAVFWTVSAASEAASVGTVPGGLASGNASYSTAPGTAPPGAQTPEQAVNRPPTPSRLRIEPLPRRRALLSWDWQRPLTVTGPVTYAVRVRRLPTGATAYEPWPADDDAIDDIAPTQHVIALDRVVGLDGLHNHDEFQFQVRATVGGQHSAWSETVTIVDNPLLRGDGYAYFKADGAEPKAFLGWDRASAAIDTSYTVRYRELPGRHWETEWVLRDQGGIWNTGRVRVSGVFSGSRSGDKLASISGIPANGALYAVHVNYEAASGKVFSARDAYFWASTVKPDRGGSSHERVATFPYYGHFDDGVFVYRICGFDFPDEIRDDEARTKWEGMIQVAIRTWEVATGGRVDTRFDGDPCVSPDWSDYEVPAGFFCPISLDPYTWLACRAAFVVRVDELFTVNAINLAEAMARALQGRENETSEVRIFDKNDHDDAEFITSIYKLCALGTASGCTVSRAYDTDVGATEATAADIYLNWDKLTDHGEENVNHNVEVVNPGMENIQFNECKAPPGANTFDKWAFELVVHEAGHALGMSGASRLRSFAEVALGSPPGFGDLADAIEGYNKLDYRTSHPTVASSVLNYGSVERARGAGTEPDCFPHPLDVLAINALYQDGYDKPVFGPFLLTTSATGGGGSGIDRSPSSPPLGYSDGTAVELTARWPTSHTFEGWGGACAHRGTLTTCTLTMDEQKHVTATFMAKEPDTAPSFSADPVNTSYSTDGRFVYALPLATGGNGERTYSLSAKPPSAIPSWLRFIPSPPTITTGTMPIPVAAAGSTYRMALTVSDADSNTGASDQDTLDVTVSVTNAVPSFSSSAVTKTHAPGDDFTEELPLATGGDGARTYSLSGNRPAWLAFTSSPRPTISTTEPIPKSAAGISYRMTLRVRDADGDTDTLSVTVAVDAISGSFSAAGTGESESAAETAAGVDAGIKAVQQDAVAYWRTTSAVAFDPAATPPYAARQRWTWNADQDISPSTVSVDLAVRPDWNYTIVIWPVATAAIATVVSEEFPLQAIYYYDPIDDVWDTYIHGAPSFVNSLSRLTRGRHYYVRVTATHTWVIRIAAGATREAGDDTAAPVPSDSGWRATVTCESGPGPIRLGVAPTEAQAIAAARWFIDSSQGCGGSGTYTVSRTQ